MITLHAKGDFSKAFRHLKKLSDASKFKFLEKYGQRGVAALSAATPVDSGLTANSWSYEIQQSGSGVSVVFLNSNIPNGFPVAIMLQYGHGTGTGGWVEGRDYINPAIRPVFDAMANEAWKEVTSV